MDLYILWPNLVFDQQIFADDVCAEFFVFMILDDGHGWTTTAQSFNRCKIIDYPKQSNTDVGETR